MHMVVSPQAMLRVAVRRLCSAATKEPARELRRVTPCGHARWVCEQVRKKYAADARHQGYKEEYEASRRRLKGRLPSAPRRAGA